MPRRHARSMPREPAAKFRRGEKLLVLRNDAVWRLRRECASASSWSAPKDRERLRLGRDDSAAVDLDGGLREQSPLDGSARTQRDHRLRQDHSLEVRSRAESHGTGDFPEERDNLQEDGEGNHGRALALRTRRHSSGSQAVRREPSVFRYSWVGDDKGDVTEVTYRLEPRSGGTRLTFQHTGFTGVGGFFLAKLMMGPGWKKMFNVLIPKVLDDVDDDGKLRPGSTLKPKY